MATWKGIVGERFTLDTFDDYCHTLQWNAWRPSFIVLHNTAIPSLAQRPDGLTQQHIKNLEAFYRDVQKWKAGPHLFIDDKQIWVFTPLTVSGTHSPSWNKLALGIEMLGDFETESFNSGRGLKVRKNTVAALATLSAVLGLDSPFDADPSGRRADDAQVPWQKCPQAGSHPGGRKLDFPTPRGRSSAGQNAGVAAGRPSHPDGSAF